MKKQITAATLALSLALTAQSAEEKSVSVDFSAEIPTILSLQIGNPSVSIELTDADYKEGDNKNTAVVTSPAAHTFAVRANIPWTVSVKASAATLTGPSGSAKPVGDLEVKTPGSSFAPLTTDPRPVEEGAGGGYLDNTYNVDYRLTSTLGSDAPGSYSLSVVYTVASK